MARLLLLLCLVALAGCPRLQSPDARARDAVAAAAAKGFTLQAGDATLLSRHFPLPAVVWALLMLAFALWCAKKALDAFIRGLKAAERQRQGTYLNG